MKTPSRWKNVLRGMLLAVAVLGLSLPVMNLLEDSSTVAVKKADPVQLPQGINVASAQTSWHTVFASNQ